MVITHNKKRFHDLADQSTHADQQVIRVNYKRYSKDPKRITRFLGVFAKQ